MSILESLLALGDALKEAGEWNPEREAAQERLKSRYFEEAMGHREDLSAAAEILPLPNKAADGPRVSTLLREGVE